MEVSHSSIQALVGKVKEEMFLAMQDPYSIIAPSAYDTAWLAMVPDECEPSQPMFKNCLDWVLNNQNEEGYWGECDGHGFPTIECLPATIACMIALKKWNAGETTMLDKGKAFIEANAEKLVGEIYDYSSPRWFAIVFPAMIELASANGLELMFPIKFKRVATEICHKYEQILESKEPDSKYRYPPLLSYLEALPLMSPNAELVINHLSEDGSVFQSPSATASAFMATGNKDCLSYLQSLAQRCPNGVPPTFPMDEELIKLCMVNQLQRMGLADHFNQEIKEVLENVHRNYLNRESQTVGTVAQKLFKDSLAFWLLRMHGYGVSPDMFCWFLLDEEIQDLIKDNHEYFSGALLNVYRATDLVFPGENKLEMARSFSRTLLERSTVPAASKDKKSVPFLTFQTIIENELKCPWIARLDHLDHRLWIEERDLNALWMGKTSYHRLSSLHNDKLRELALQNYEFRQSVYKNELEELKRWSKSWGLTDMGFGREKTTFCYFAIAASTLLPSDSEIRMMVAKSAIIITVADDFYDMEGSLDELQTLTDAIRRWDDKSLSGHSKTIFDALDNLVKEISAKYLQREGSNITNELRSIWYETFASWFTEACWSRSGHIPSAEKYLETGMTSIAAHTIVLTASLFLKPSLPDHKLKPDQYETITKLVMVICRLLNDVQSYEVIQSSIEKERKEGKTNFVLLHLKENPEAEIEDSIAYVKEILHEKNKEMLEHALMDGFNDLSVLCRHLHLSCLKVFQMFFDSTNLYDSNTELLEDIQKAIYLPPQVGEPQPSKLLPRHRHRHDHPESTKTYQTRVNCQIGRQPYKHFRISLPATSRVSLSIPKNLCMTMPVIPKFKFRFA